MYAVQISGTTSPTSSPSVTSTYTILYYCDGRYKYTDSLGSLVCGKWVCKCGKLCTLVKGEDKLLGNKGSGKFVESKEGNKYNGNIYISDKCKCNLQYRYVLTPLLK